MHLVSFDIFRTLGFPDTTVLKPDQFLRHKELLREADWVLFPEYWQLNALVHGLKCRVFPSEGKIGIQRRISFRAGPFFVPGSG